METSMYSTTSPIPKTLEYKYSSMSSYDALYEDLYSGFSMFSIDGYNGNSQYIANGYDLNNTARLYFGIGRNQSITFNTPDVSCMPYWYEKYDTDPYVMPRPIYFPFDVISVQNESLLLKYGDTPESYNIEVDCEY